jgi:hypothetical protein
MNKRGSFFEKEKHKTSPFEQQKKAPGMADWWPFCFTEYIGSVVNGRLPDDTGHCLQFFRSKNGHLQDDIQWH